MLVDKAHKTWACASFVIILYQLGFLQNFGLSTNFAYFILGNLGHGQDCEGFKWNDAYSFDGEHQKQDVTTENPILVLQFWVLFETWFEVQIIRMSHVQWYQRCFWTVSQLEGKAHDTCVVQALCEVGRGAATRVIDTTAHRRAPGQSRSLRRRTLLCEKPWRGAQQSQQVEPYNGRLRKAPQSPPPSVHWSLQGVPLGQSKQRKHRLKNKYKKNAEDFSMPFCDVQSRLITKAVLRQLDYFQRAPPMDRINPWYSITEVGPNPPHHYHHQHPPHQAHHYCHNNPPRHHPFPPQHHPPHYHLHPRLARQALEKRRFSRFLPTHSPFLSLTPFYSAQHLRQCEKPNLRLGPNQSACMPTNNK